MAFSYSVLALSYASFNDSAKSAYDSVLYEFSKLTGLTFNYTDETDTTIDEVSDKSSDTKEKGLLSKFFGSRKK